MRDRIAADINAVATADPALASGLTAVGQALRVGSTADFNAMIDGQQKRVAAIAAAIGLVPQ